MDHNFNKKTQYDRWNGYMFFRLCDEVLTYNIKKDTVGIVISSGSHWYAINKYISNNNNDSKGY